MYKYTIYNLMRKQPYEQFHELQRELPKMLGVGFSTFRNWMYIKKDDHQTVPADSLYQLAVFFKVPFCEMFTETPQKIDFTNLNENTICGTQQ